MREKALSQMSQVAIGVSFWCDAFIDLRDTDVLPRNILAGEGSEHLPWRAPSADRENETVPLANTLTGRGSHKGRRPLRDRLGVIEYLDVHRDRLALRFLLVMTAEPIAHRGKNFVREVGLAARAEALVERCREDVGGNRLVDGGLDRPTPLAGI